MQSHDITLARIKLIHCIIMRNSIDLENVICDTFSTYASDKGIERIEHGGLITAMCYATEVDMSDGETLVPFEKSIDRVFISTIREYEGFLEHHGDVNGLA